MKKTIQCLLTVIFLATITSCSPNPETEQALEVSKELYEAHKNLDQKIKESERILDVQRPKLEREVGDFEKITPITDAKKNGTYDSIKVVISSYEE